MINALVYFCSIKYLDRVKILKNSLPECHIGLFTTNWVTAEWCWQHRKWNKLCSKSLKWLEISTFVSMTSNNLSKRFAEKNSYGVKLHVYSTFLLCHLRFSFTQFYSKVENLLFLFAELFLVVTSCFLTVSMFRSLTFCI